MISGLERRNSLRQGRHRPKQGDCAASRLLRLVSSRDSSPPTSSAISILCPFATVSNYICPEARKQCSCEALICLSCHKQVQRGGERQSCAKVCTTLPNIPSRHCRIAVNRLCPASPAKDEALLLDFGRIHATRLSQGCVQMRASAPLPRRHHTTVKVLCASGGGPGYLGELPLVHSTSMLLILRRKSS